MVNAVLGSPLFPAKKKKNKKNTGTLLSSLDLSHYLYTYYLAAGLGL